MKTKTEKDFKAVEFMRQVREEMSALYYEDREKYLDELKKAMANFLVRREESTSTESVGID